MVALGVDPRVQGYKKGYTPLAAARGSKHSKKAAAVLATLVKKHRKQSPTRAESGLGESAVMAALAALEPKLVLMHWSAFEKTGDEDCLVSRYDRDRAACG